MGKRQKAALETKQKLVTAAKMLILERGFNNFNVSDITEKAGVAKGSFYTYFKHKEEIIEEVTHQNIFPLRDRILEFKGNVADKISHYLCQAMLQIAEYGLVSAQNWLRLGMEPGNICVLKKMHLDIDVLEGILKSGIQSGEFREDVPIESIKHCIVAEFYGAVVVWCISNGSVNAMDIIEYYCSHQLPALINDNMRV